MSNHSKHHHPWIATAIVVMLISTASYSLAAESKGKEIININGRQLKFLSRE
jgi:hypothetical protein